MGYRDSRHYTCKHSRRSRVSGYGSRSLAVYASCRNPEKRHVGKHYMVADRDFCEYCNHYKPL